jgi:hypothetical protein
VPPLRERREDIAPLAAHFAAKYGARFSRAIQRIGKRSLKALESYSWPGNVRELENIIERAVILSRHGTLRVDPGDLPGSSGGSSLPSGLLAQEREAIEAALRNSAGRVSGTTGAALSLAMPASTLESRIRRLGIDTGAAARQRRTFCRPCMDWRERRHHLAGALGAALLSRIGELKWAARDKHSRVIRFTPAGRRAFRDLFEAADSRESRAVKPPAASRIMHAAGQQFP